MLSEGDANEASADVDLDFDDDANHIDEITELVAMFEKKNESDKCTPVLSVVHGRQPAIPAIPALPLLPKAPPSLFIRDHGYCFTSLSSNSSRSSRSSPSTQPSPSPSSSSSPKTASSTRKQGKQGIGNVWTEEETCCLREGMALFESHKHRWALIKARFPLKLQQRTNIDLKDRWRNLQGRKQNRKKRKRKLGISPSFG